jgi:hypothetical protein
MPLAFISEAAGHRDFGPGGAVARPSEVTIFDFLATTTSRRGLADAAQ